MRCVPVALLLVKTLILPLDCVVTLTCHVWRSTTKHIKVSELIPSQHVLLIMLVSSYHQTALSAAHCHSCLAGAYELAFASTYMFAGQRPVFKEVDEVTFMRPVDVGDLLRLRSCILHTKPSSLDSDKVLP